MLWKKDKSYSHSIHHELSKYQRKGKEGFMTNTVLCPRMVGPIEYSFRSFFSPPPPLNSRHINWKIIISNAHSYFLLRKFYEYFFSIYFMVGGWIVFLFSVLTWGQILSTGVINNHRDESIIRKTAVVKFLQSFWKFPLAQPPRNH